MLGGSLSEPSGPLFTVYQEKTPTKISHECPSDMGSLPAFTSFYAFGWTWDTESEKLFPGDIENINMNEDSLYSTLSADQGFGYWLTTSYDMYPYKPCEVYSFPIPFFRGT